MGKRRKTLNIWLKRTRDSGGVEGTRLETKDKKISKAKDSLNRSVVEWIERLATEAVDSGSIPGRVKPKTRKIGIHSFPA